MKEHWFDYRFFVKVEDYREALHEIMDYLPESTEEIWYTVSDSSGLQEALQSSKPKANSP